MLQEQKQKNKIQMELDPKEVELIKRIREQYRWGEIIVECQNGLPWRIGKTTIYEKLD